MENGSVGRPSPAQVSGAVIPVAVVVRTFPAQVSGAVTPVAVVGRPSPTHVPGAVIPVVAEVAVAADWPGKPPGSVLAFQFRLWRTASFPS